MVKHIINGNEPEIDRFGKAEELLIEIENGNEVSRWQVSILSKEIYSLIRDDARYHHLKWDVDDIVDSANESR